jgi:lipopolysaccharide transport system ATP-binding protein
MSTPSVIVDGIGKKYRIGMRALQHRTFREAMMGAAAAPLRRFKALREHGSQEDTIWAIRDISFSLDRGEVVGIIGRNGAGKSTLLKVLSRITEPTEGNARIRGRVASLLEVGTGFHPELTGRENIFLNGAILGMKHAEIKRKFDEIVAFAEIDKFLETPVKRYSSGMAVRLAFAVAAHLEPEILVVDEVLAVGDAAFQKRCLGKMHEVATGQGRTVLFVSHNMAAIRSLCDTAILLEGGRITMQGTAEQCTSEYLQQLYSSSLSSIVELERPRGAAMWMERLRLLVDGKVECHAPLGSEMTLEIEFGAEIPVRYPRVGIIIHAGDGTRLLHACNKWQNSQDLKEPTRRGVMRCELGKPPLVAGQYSISLWFGDGIRDIHNIEHVMTFEVSDRDIWGNGKTPSPHHSMMWWPTEYDIMPRAVHEQRYAVQEAPIVETTDDSDAETEIPMVSVVMPVRNAERYLDQAIGSLLAQTLRDFELIVIDDGSTDRSPEIIQRYADNDARIRPVLREHRGITPTLNQGLQLARGRYFCTLDADDVAAPELLDQEVSYLESHPECVLVACRLLLIDAEGAPIRTTNIEETHEDIDAALMGFHSFYTANGYLARRETVVEVGGFREDVALAEDRDLCLRLAERGRMGHIAEPLYLYRQHTTNVCQERMEELNECVRRVVSDARGRRRLEALPAEVGPPALGRLSNMHRHRTWAWWALKAGNVGTARKHARACWWRAPWSPESWRVLLCSLRGH